MANNKNFVVKSGLEVGNNSLYVDSTTNRIGIGTNITGNNKISITDTWNSGATAFTGIKFDVTDTASSSSSLLLDLLVASSSKFSVDKTGNIVVGGTLNTHTIPGGTGTLALISDISWTLSDGSASEVVANGNTVTVAGGTYLTSAVTATDTLTINHDTTSRTDTTSNASPVYGATFDVVDSVTTNATGHLTAINVKTVTVPASDNTDTLQTIAEDATDVAQYITFVPNTTGAQTGRVDAGLTYNPSSNFLNVGGDLTVGGDLIVNGTTTTVNSTTVTIDDPVFTLGGDTAPGADDNKDRGIEFRWHNGSAAKVGFFGFDDSTGKFTFIPDATNTAEVFSGVTGELDAKVDWSNLLNIPGGGGSDTLGFNIVGASSTAVANAIATNGNVWLNHVESSVAVSNHNIIGAGGTTVTSDANGDITISSSSTASAISTITVTDTDSGFTWAETGSVVADQVSDTVTFVSGTNINIDVDATSDAIRVQTRTDQHILDNHTIVSNTQTTTSIAQVALDTFSATTFAGAEVVVTAIQGTSRHIIKMLITHDDTSTYETLFGEIITGSSLFDVTSNIVTGNVQIQCTPTSVTSTKFNTYITRIEN